MSHTPQPHASGPKPRASHHVVEQAPDGVLAGDVGLGAGARVGRGVGLKSVVGLGTGAVDGPVGSSVGPDVGAYLELLPRCEPATDPLLP